LTLYAIDYKIELIHELFRMEVKAMGDKNPKKAPKKKGGASAASSAAGTKKK
jgi:hypothetical protein